MARQISSRSPHENLQSHTVDKVLKQCLGEEATQLIYYRLENHYLVQRSEIPEKLDSLSHVLEDYLGKGAVIVEKTIIESL